MVAAPCPRGDYLLYHTCSLTLPLVALDTFSATLTASAAPLARLSDPLELLSALLGGQLSVLLQNALNAHGDSVCAALCCSV